MRINGTAPEAVEKAATNAMILAAARNEYCRLIAIPSRAEQIDIDEAEISIKGFRPTFSIRSTGMKVVRRLMAAT